MRALKYLLVVSLAAGLVACSDDGAVSDSTPLVDAPVTNPDGGTDGPVVYPDGPLPPDAGPAAALQVVIDKLTLPKSNTDYAKDLDGNGTKDNQLGGILGVMNTLGIDMQTDLDNQINSGALSLLFEVFADSIADATDAKLQFHLGAPLPTANEYGIATASPPNLVLDGAIVGGHYDGGPGTFTIPVPLGTTVMLNLEKAYVSADVTSGGMTNGLINGAIPSNDVDQTLIPAIAQLMTDGMSQMPLLATFDANKDGTISADELRNNALLKLALAPDVDTDGDQKADALSVGMAFTAKACTIKK